MPIIIIWPSSFHSGIKANQSIESSVTHDFLPGGSQEGKYYFRCSFSAGTINYHNGVNPLSIVYCVAKDTIGRVRYGTDTSSYNIFRLWWIHLNSQFIIIHGYFLSLLCSSTLLCPAVSWSCVTMLLLFYSFQLQLCSWYGMKDTSHRLIREEEETGI